MAATRALTVDLGAYSGANFLKRFVQFPDTIKNCVQIRFTGYYVKNASVEDLLVEISSTWAANAYLARDQSTAPTLTATSLRGVPIAEPISATGKRVDLNSKVDMVDPGRVLSPFSQLAFTVTNFAGNTPPTWDRLILFFELVTVDASQNPLSNFANLPSTRLTQLGYNEF